MSVNPIFFFCDIVNFLHQYNLTRFLFLNQTDLCNINALDLHAVELPAIPT